MSWNYRVIKMSKDHFVIRECYYNKNTDKLPGSMAGVGHPSGHTKDELRRALERMLKALDKPTIDFDKWWAETHKEK